MSRIVRMTIEDVKEEGGLLYVSGRTMAGERLERVLYVQGHGAAFSPPLGAIATAMDMTGRREQMLVMGGEKPGTRPTGIGAGETYLYNASGQVISIINNEIRITGGAKVKITATDIVLEGNVKLGGEGATTPIEKVANIPCTKVFGL